MVKVIVTLTAAAGVLFGQLVQSEAAAQKPEPQKEVLQPAAQSKPILKKSKQHDTQLA